MYDLENYFEAGTIEEAVDLLAGQASWKIIAGGTDLLIKMHKGKLERAHLLSIRRLKSLEAVRKYEDQRIGIGALATFGKIAGDQVIKENIPILAEAAGAMGGPQIRSVATIGGNICNGAPSADSAPTLFALNAQLKLQAKTGERVVSIREFYLGPSQVDLRPGEILKEILITPENYQGFGGHYLKFSLREAMDLATLGVAVICTLTEANNFATVRIGLGVAGPTPLRCPEAEAYATGKTASRETIAAIGKLAVRSSQARTSWRASKEYREHLIEELTQRALKIAVARAGGEIIE